jgi:hypothetical protein
MRSSVSPAFFKRKDAEPLVPGEPARIRFPLYASSVLLRKGHRIRVSLAGADADVYLGYPRKMRQLGLDIEGHSAHLSLSCPRDNTKMLHDDEICHQRAATSAALVALSAKKTFNAHFLQDNILRRSKARNRRKQPQRGVAPAIVNRQKWRRRIDKIQNAPAAGHRRITEQPLQEAFARLVRRVSGNLTMHSLNDACCHRSQKAPKRLSVLEWTIQMRVCKNLWLFGFSRAWLVQPAFAQRPFASLRRGHAAAATSADGEPRRDPGKVWSALIP